MAEDSLAPRRPFRALVCGASGTGKTFQTSQLLLEHYTPKQGVDRLVWVAPSYSLSQPIVKLLATAYPAFISVDGNEGWTPEVRKAIEEGINKGRHREANGFYPNDCILVVDDMLCAGKREKYVSSLYTTARHLGVSIVELSQRIFGGDMSARTQRLNCTQFWLFAFNGGPGEVRHLLQQTEDKEMAKKVYEAYRQIVSADPHGYLYLDLTQPERSPLRYRNSSLSQGLAFT